MQEKHISYLANQLNIPTHKIEKTLGLLLEGATVPFIARYRKEVTGSLDEVAILAIQQQHKKFVELEKRKETILKAIEEQGKLTPDLRKRIEETFDSSVLEDIYLPYKKKRQTRATIAKNKGLEPLAKKLFFQNHQSIQQYTSDFLNKDVESIEDALSGAKDIIAEWINEDEKARNKIRFLFKREALVTSKVARGKKEEAQKYKDYFEFEESLKKCPSHRILAIRRGEEEGFLRVSIAPNMDNALYQLDRLFLKGDGEATDQVAQAIEDCYKRLLSPSIETEFRNLSKQKADEEAINVFAENLKQLLLSAPLGQKKILAVDPGFRTGCKVVCLNDSGDLIYNGTIFPHPPQQRVRESAEDLKALVKKHNIEAIAVGNGTAGRETLSLCQGIDFGKPVQVFMVNESGASIYSASEIAREEFPDKDVTVRGAVSIGRRLMDPLAELVKIDPKSIGVGQYQHDVNQTQLRESLGTVVESCVNSVGINLNTASKHLLTYVSGLGPTLAQNIVNYRKENGRFISRKQLKKVARMGDKAFEQCAGFLRIREAKHPLDNTGVHPESYHLVEQMAKDLNCSMDALIESKALREQIELKRYVTPKAGLPTLQDILKEIEKPGLDPRGEAKAFEFSNAVKTMEDLNIGMILPGIVTNITNFGAFVDVGVKQDGLVHVSQMADKFVKNPTEIVQLQQEVQVKVLEVDIQRKRVTLTMKPSQL